MQQIWSVLQVVAPGGLGAEGEEGERAAAIEEVAEVLLACADADSEAGDGSAAPV